MNDYKTDRCWADKFIPELKRIVADLLIVAAPEEEDMHRNTDLIVLGAEAKRVACRVRRYHYFERWPNDITFRSLRPGVRETELAKLISGFGDYFIYAFASEDETHLLAWRIIDLCEFRKWFWFQVVNYKVTPGIEQDNNDGSSKFRAFDIRMFRPGICQVGGEKVTP